jgi:hypothetical protein
MALTILEKYEITREALAPDALSLYELVKQSAINHAMSFRDNYKAVNVDTHPDAMAYLNAMFVLSRDIIRLNDTMFRALLRVMIELIGDTATDLPQVQAATDTQWAAFVDGQMVIAMEHVASVRQEQKAEYDSL